MSNIKDKKVNISGKQSKSIISTPIKEEKKNSGSRTRIVSLVAIFLLILGLYFYGIVDKSSIEKFINKASKENELVKFEETEEQSDDLKRVLENAKKNQEIANALLTANGNTEANNGSHGAVSKSEDSKSDSAEKVDAVNDSEVNRQNVTQEFSSESESKADLVASEEKSSRKPEELEELNPYELELGRVEYIPTVQKHIVLKNATQYRKFLWNAHKMIEKFHKDEVFVDEIRILKMRVLPEEIAEILEKFVEYNDLLQDKDLKPYKRVDFGSEFFSRFLTIKKSNDEYQSVSQLKEEILSEMSVFYKYLYSDRLQDEFFGK